MIGRGTINVEYVRDMAYVGKAIDKMEQLVPEKAAKAVKAAYKRALNKAGGVLVVEDGTIYRVTSDGTRSVVKRVDKKIPVKKGTKLKIT